MSLPPAVAQLNRTAESAASAAATVQLYGEALKMCPSNAPALYGLGRALLEQNRIPAALKSFRHLNRLFPDDPEVLTAMAATLARWPNPRRAEILEGVSLAERATQLAPDLPAAWHTLSVLHAANGDIPAATHAARKAIELQENLPADSETLNIYIQQEQQCYELLVLFSPLD